MSTPGGSLACEGMYSKLIDDEGAHDEVNLRPDVGLGENLASRDETFSSVSSSLPGPPVRTGPRPGGPGPYRLATICLATLCAVLLISIIAVTSKKEPQRDAGGTSEMQKKDANTSALTAAISKLQQEKEELQAKLDLMVASKVPEVTKPPTRAPPVCPPDWSLFNHSCYFISRTTRDWPEAKSFCQSQGAHLAIILTAEEQTFLWDLLPRGHWNSFWFGITDEHTEDQWKWVDGSALVGGFWEVGEPNNHIDEDCGYIVKTRVLERVAIQSWYDAPCTMYLPFICEKEMGRGASTATPH